MPKKLTKVIDDFELCGLITAVTAEARSADFKVQYGITVPDGSLVLKLTHPRKRFQITAGVLEVVTADLPITAVSEVDDGDPES